MQTRCGYIALIGRPNAGKSTLFNRLVGQKLSSISFKPQTTRHRIVGVKTTDDAQFVFVDTPGIHLGGKKLLNKVLNKNALGALENVDLILWLVDCQRWTPEEDFICRLLQDLKCPVILVINKIDTLAKKDELFAIIEAWSGKYPFAEVIPVSALKKENLDELINTSKQYLPESEFYYADEYITDRDIRFSVSEAIREAIFIYLEKEIPYASHVEVESIQAGENSTQISAAIWVEKESQKVILIGHKGEMIKKIGTRARKAIQKQLAMPIHLELWVKLKKDWQNNPQVVGQYEL